MTLPEHIDPVAADLLEGDGDDGRWNKFLQAVGQDGADFLHGLAAGINFAGQRESQAAIRANQHFLLQIGLFPDRNIDDIAGLASR